MTRDRTSSPRSAGNAGEHPSEKRPRESRRGRQGTPTREEHPLGPSPLVPLIERVLDEKLEQLVPQLVEMVAARVNDVRPDEGA